MWYFVTKRGDHPYSGPSWQRAGIKAEFYLSFEKADNAARSLTSVNPVGFQVIELDSTLKPCNDRGYPYLVKNQ